MFFFRFINSINKRIVEIVVQPNIGNNQKQDAVQE